MCKVTHNIAKCTFQVESQPDSAHLNYEFIDDGHINFTHTYVPFRQRGKGVAEALVQAGLKWAYEENLIISTSCWYVEKYMAEYS